MSDPLPPELGAHIEHIKAELRVMKKLHLWQMIALAIAAAAIGDIAVRIAVGVRVLLG